MTETKFNLQAALDALERATAVLSGDWSPIKPKDRHSSLSGDATILRDLRERLAGANPAWRQSTGALNHVRRGNARPVLIINVNSEV